MRRSILIIDAEADFVEPLATFLHARGFDVVVTEDGKDGLARAESLPPDAILVSVELPQMSGYSICARLKKHPKLKAVPLFITSASKETQAGFKSHKQLRTQADEYMSKPFSGPELLERLEPYLDLEAEPKDSDATEIGEVAPSTADLLRKLREQEVAERRTIVGESPITRDLLSEFKEISDPAPAKIRGSPRAEKPPRSATPPPYTARPGSQTPTENSSASSPGSSPVASQARSVLALKQELSAKDRELLELKEKLQAIERARLEWLEKETTLEQRALLAEEERDAMLQANARAEAKLTDAVEKISQLETKITESERAYEDAINALQSELDAAQTRETQFPARKRARADEAPESIHASLAEKNGLIATLTKKVDVLRARNKAKEAELIRLFDERFLALSEVKSITERLEQAQAARDSASKEAARLRIMLEETRGLSSSEIRALAARFDEPEAAPAPEELRPRHEATFDDASNFD